MLGTDTVTIYKKLLDGSFSRRVVSGVQWSDQSDVTNMDGRVTVAEHASVTFFEGTYGGLDLQSFTEEDAVFFGVVDDTLEDGRVSRLLKTYPRSGVIKSVNDNSNRRYLKNIKVVLV